MMEGIKNPDTGLSEGLKDVKALETLDLQANALTDDHTGAIIKLLS
jgi:hypothetical protein